MKGHKQLILAVYVIVNGTLLGRVIFKENKKMFFLLSTMACVFFLQLTALSARFVFDN